MLNGGEGVEVNETPICSIYKLKMYLDFKIISKVFVTIQYFSAP